MKVYGLTGGIASGKSAASKRFIERGIPVIDADATAHGVIEPGGAAYEGVVDAFGKGIVSEGKIDRVKLGEIVFADPEALARLNGLVHPAVGVEMAKRLAALQEEEHAVAIIEAALHAEDGTLREGMTGLILVICPQEERIRRLMEERGLSAEEAEQRIQAQTPPEAKMHLASWVIHNDESLDHLNHQVDGIVEEMMSPC